MEMYLHGKKKTNDRYEALGFVEALIGIMVTGIAATVLMSISASAMRNMMRSETIDEISQIARSGAIQAQKIADDEGDIPSQDKSIAKLSEDENICYPFTLSGIQGDNMLLSRASWKNYPIENDSDFFRVICLKGVNGNKAVVEIVSGVINMRGLETTSSDIKDYKYIAVIDL